MRGSLTCGSIERSITPTATAAITTATTASTTSPTVAAPTATATTLLPWLGFVDRQLPPVMLVVIESLDRCLSLGVRVHLDKTEPLRAVRIPVYDDLGVWTVPNGANNASRSDSLTL